jgi:putative effector of murein hydrolase
VHSYLRRFAAWFNGLRHWQAIRDAMSRPSSAPSPGFSSANTITNNVGDGLSETGVGVDDENGGATQLGSEDDAPRDPPLQQRQHDISEKLPERPHSKPATVVGKPRSWVDHNPVLCLCALCAVIVGIPVCLAAHQDSVLDTCLLFTLWLGFQVLQAKVKGCRGSDGEKYHRDEKDDTTGTKRGCDEKIRIVAASLLNSVLWTALAMMAYVKIKAAVRQTDFADALGALQSNITVVDILSPNQNASAAGSSSPMQLSSSALLPNDTYTGGEAAAYASRLNNNAALHMQAGDIALSVLDAGLVVWGLKLYECRRQLLSRSGFTVAILAALAALGNVCAGPLLAAKLGLAPAASDLSFAARSVTLALAVPAMRVLGGDAGLNAAMVVASGVVFQVVMSLGVGHWLDDRISHFFEKKKSAGSSLDKRWSLFRCSSCRGHSSAVSGDLEAGRPRQKPHQDRNQERQTRGHQPDRPASESRHQVAPGMSNASFNDSEEKELEGSDRPRTVAAGIMVGINAAAMGTAHLYEISSSAAPYSVLAMTAYGVVTVVLANALSGWLRGQISA